MTNQTIVNSLKALIDSNATTHDFIVLNNCTYADLAHDDVSQTALLAGSYINDHYNDYVDYDENLDVATMKTGLSEQAVDNIMQFS